MLRRPPSAIEPLIKVAGDRLDPSIEISSYGASAITNKGLLVSTTTENSFMRAFIDKKDGKVSTQIYHIENYSGEWKYFNSATYEAPEGIKEVSANRVGSDVNCYRWGCSFTEEVVFPVDFAILEKAAAAFDPANPLNGLRYRLFAKSGDRVDEAIPINEIVAFVAVVNRARGDGIAK